MHVSLALQVNRRAYPYLYIYTCKLLSMYYLQLYDYCILKEFVDYLDQKKKNILNIFLIFGTKIFEMPKTIDFIFFQCNIYCAKNND